MPLNKDTKNILDPLLATFSETLESTLVGQLAEVYISGQAEMIIRQAFRQATEGKGLLQYILSCICVAICFPIGIIQRLIKK